MDPGKQSLPSDHCLNIRYGGPQGRILNDVALAIETCGDNRSTNFDALSGHIAREADGGARRKVCANVVAGEPRGVSFASAPHQLQRAQHAPHQGLAHQRTRLLWFEVLKQNVPNTAALPLHTKCRNKTTVIIYYLREACNIM